MYLDKRRRNAKHFEDGVVVTRIMSKSQGRCQYPHIYADSLPLPYSLLSASKRQKTLQGRVVQPFSKNLQLQEALDCVKQPQTRDLNGKRYILLKRVHTNALSKDDLEAITTIFPRTAPLLSTQHYGQLY